MSADVAELLDHDLRELVVVGDRADSKGSRSVLPPDGSARSGRCRLEESLSAGTKSGMPRRAQAPRIEPLSCAACSARSARNWREDIVRPESVSANLEIARSVAQYFSSSMNVS